MVASRISAVCRAADGLGVSVVAGDPIGPRGFDVDGLSNAAGRDAGRTVARCTSGTPKGNYRNAVSVALRVDSP